MIMLGIDPGSHRTGYAVVKRDDKVRNRTLLLDYGTIEVPPKTPSPDNLLVVKNELNEILRKYKPQMACVEDIFFAKNVKTAKTVMECRGVILLGLHEAGLEILQPTATQIKKGVTGNGNSGKKEIGHALKILMGLDELTGHDDSWDAIAAGFVGLSMSGSRVMY